MILRIADVTFVRRDGAPASRPRIFWRTLVAWCPLVVTFAGPIQEFIDPDTPARLAALPLMAFVGLAVLSVVLPNRGLPDRLAGTWPVRR